jgi:hypothetical protein
MIPSAAIANMCSMPNSVETRRCGQCHEVKAITEFKWRQRRGGEYDYMCRDCRAQYAHKHYQANRQQYLERAAISKRKLKLERTRFLLDYFQDHPCADCGEADPVVLEFDHLKDKSFNIGDCFAGRTWESVLAEIEKCEVVCRNCHRRRESRRVGALRVLLTEDGPPRLF